MPKKIDTKKIEECIREILIALGDDPNREGLLDTPKRVAKMYEEVFEGMTHTNEEIAKMFGTTFENEDTISEINNNMVVVKDIPIHSYCEHHLALMYNMKVSVVYIPKEKIIGLSKISRIADMVGRRLQLQERIGSDIAVESSDAVLVSDDIKRIPHLLYIADRTMKKVNFNIIFSMSLNLLAVALAVTGILNPVWGALVHNLGSVFVVINSALLLTAKSNFEASWEA